MYSIYILYSILSHWHEGEVIASFLAFDATSRQKQTSTKRARDRERERERERDRYIDR